MAFKIVLALCVMIAVSSAVPGSAAGGFGGWGGWGGWGAAGAAGGVAAGPGPSPFVPPWVAQAPWFPQWGPCTVIGSSCLDCSTRLVCTKVGGLQRACTDPALPHCNLGECSATPADECAAPAAPAQAAST